MIKNCLNCALEPKWKNKIPAHPDITRYGVCPYLDKNKELGENNEQ